MSEFDPFSEAARFGVNWSLSGYQVSELAAAFTRAKADSAEEGHLAAAAPDLLEALQEVMQWIGGWDPSFTQDEEWPSTADKARYAIAKTNGFVVSDEDAPSLQDSEAIQKMAETLSAECDRLFEEAMRGGPGRKAAAEKAWAESVYPPKRPEYPKLVAKVVDGKLMLFIEHGLFNVDTVS